MRQLALFNLILSLYYLPLSALNISVRADSCLLINADTGNILYEKNGKKLQYPASLTKVATALYAIKMCPDKMDRLIAAEQDAIASVKDEQMKKSNYTLPAHWLTVGTSHIGIKRGEELTLRDLLYGTLVASGGDASNVIAQYVGGTTPQFMVDLNSYLKEIGCENTNFKNPHGLHHPKHQSTAYDIALMMRQALKEPIFRTIIKTKSCKRPKTNKQEATVLVQTNRMIRQGKHYYPFAIGGKTGYTSLAKNCLAVAAEKDGRTLIAVLLKGDDRDLVFEDAKRLFIAAFQEKKQQKRLLSKGLQKQALKIEKASSVLKAYLKEDLVFSFYPSENPKLKCTLHWYQLPLPIQKDQEVGYYEVKTGEGASVFKAPLFAEADVSLSFWHRFF